LISQEQFHSSKILIVDDESSNIRLLEELLGGKGYTCIESITDPRKTMEVYLEFQPDVLLLDLNMPHLNGFQVLEQLNNLDLQYHVPVMVLTAQADRESRVKALKLGARDYLSKPFDLIELSMRIRNLLEVRLLIGQLYDNKIYLEEKLSNNVFELAVAMTKIKEPNPGA
jgi:putative two-component system response regulator